MAGQIPDLIASVRTGTGKGAARQSRREGNVPGIVFGGEADPLPINISFNKLFSLLKAGRFKSTLFNLKLEGHDDVRVICRGATPHRERFANPCRLHAPAPHIENQPVYSGRIFE